MTDPDGPTGSMFGIREVYDNGVGAVVGWSADAIDVSGDSTDDLRGTLERMMELLEQDVLDPDALNSQSVAARNERIAFLEI